MHVQCTAIVINLQALACNSRYYTGAACSSGHIAQGQALSTIASATQVHFAVPVILQKNRYYPTTAGTCTQAQSTVAVILHRNRHYPTATGRLINTQVQSAVAFILHRNRH